MTATITLNITLTAEQQQEIIDRTVDTLIQRIQPHMSAFARDTAKAAMLQRCREEAAEQVLYERYEAVKKKRQAEALKRWGYPADPPTQKGDDPE